MAMLSTSTVGF